MSASIVLNAKDEISPSMKSIQANGKSLGRDFDELSGKIQALQEKNNALNKSYSTLNSQLVDAKKAVKDATAAYKEAATEENKTNLNNATYQYKSLSDQMKTFRDGSSDTRKEIRSLQEESRKLADGTRSSISDGSGGAFTALARAGLGQMVGQSVQQYANYMAFDDAFRLRSWSLDGTRSADITDYLKSLTWSGSYTDCARQMTADILPDALCELGGAVRLYRDTDMAGKTYTVSYNRISYLLLSIPGVKDYTALTVDGATANITIAADEVPVLTGVTVPCASCETLPGQCTR